MMDFQEKKPISLEEFLNLMHRMQRTNSGNLIEILYDDKDFLILKTLCKANDLPEDFFEKVENREKMIDFVDSGLNFYTNMLSKKK